MSDRLKFVLCIVLSTATLAACSANSYPPVEVLHSDRGRIDRDKDGTILFIKTDQIPFREGESYVWRMYIRTNKAKIKVTEEVTVSGPTTWGGTSDLKVSNNGRTVTKAREIDNASGIVVGAWKITDGDPAGPVQIKVTIENTVVQQFNFVLKKL